MVRAFYCKELTGFTTEELHEFLADAERAPTLGFDPDRFAADRKTAPSRTTLGRRRYPARVLDVQDDMMILRLDAEIADVDAGDLLDVPSPDESCRFTQLKTRYRCTQ